MALGPGAAAAAERTPITTRRIAAPRPRGFLRYCTGAGPTISEMVSELFAKPRGQFRQVPTYDKHTKRESMSSFVPPHGRPSICLTDARRLGDEVPAPSSSRSDRRAGRVDRSIRRTLIVGTDVGESRRCEKCCDRPVEAYDASTGCGSSGRSPPWHAKNRTVGRIAFGYMRSRRW